MHLVGFTIETCYDALPFERNNSNTLMRSISACKAVLSYQDGKKWRRRNLRFRPM